MAPLTGKTAFVTGGSRGIGAAVVRRLAAEGARVAFTYVQSRDGAEALSQEVAALGGTALPLQADSADAAALAEAIDSGAAALGGLDILVGSAGILRVGPVETFPLAEFDALMAVNVRAVFAGAQAAARHLRDGGRIITIGSVNAERIPVAGLTAYGTSKAAVVGMTKGLAREFAPRGITVNVIQPGPIDTDMNPATGPFAPFLTGLMALPRYGTAEDVAGLVAYLAGPDAGFVTGAAFTIDGGFLA